MTVQIRDVHERDLGLIAEIERECFSLPWDEQMLKMQLNDSHVFLAADLDGKISGYIGLQYVLDEGYISNVAVAPQSRRRGVAEALINELHSRAKALELSFVSLEVRASNIAAIALYSKHGYAELGRRKGYYEKPREDALIMTRFL